MAADHEAKIRHTVDDLRKRARKIEALRGIWADTPGGGTDELLAERRRERELEERKAQRWGVDG